MRKPLFNQLKKKWKLFTPQITMNCNMTRLTNQYKIIKRIIENFTISTFFINMMNNKSFSRLTNLTSIIISFKNSLIITPKSMFINMTSVFFNSMSIHIRSILFKIRVVFSSRLSPLLSKFFFINHMRNYNIYFRINKGGILS